MQICVSKTSLTLARDKRIRKRREYLRIQRCGVRSFGRFLVGVAQREREGVGKIGITVPKKVGAAHVRNKIKRRLRHILRVNQDLFLERQLVVVARDNASVATFSELELDLKDICRRFRYNNSIKPPRPRNTEKIVA